ncbi:MAG: S8 family peptidase [bacterium]
MNTKPLLAFLASAAITVIAAMPLHVTAVAAAQPEFAADAAAKNRFTNNAYIVQLAEPPVSAYTGGIKGLKATKPRRGQKIDPNSPAVINYMSFLASRQETVLNAVGGGRKLHSYGYVFNGFAADLTPEQVAKLASMPGVLAVTKDEFRSLDTATTPDFLGLTGRTGVWAGNGDGGTTGEDVIIGIIDSGVWPEHPSFSDRTGSNGNASKDGKLAYQQIPGWNGRCVPGEDFAASNCNQKLIGARFYNEGFGGNAGIDASLPFEFNSPRDHNGHGTHTATTAGGNAGVATTGSAEVLGTISGIAPRARIASYKACWSVPGTAGSCAGVDLVAAIDQAVADGVDVINYSISGTRTNFRDPVEIAFLFAADTGIFVAASAGNSGPASSTVAHPGPWLTTVAAGTHDRDGVGSTTLGNGSTYSGASLATLGAVSGDLIDATDAALPGIDSYFARLCYSTADTGGVPVLDPAKIGGKVVVCDRGDTARVNKSLAVKEAGGVGMILLNTSVASLNADLHAVPSVHVQFDAATYAAIHDYAKTAGATATINQASITNTAPAPVTASFSSRGPLQAGAGDLLKPDLIAPGVDILAGVAPPNNGGNLFDLYSGTSMSSPHVAGLAALFKQKYPSWSPMAIKSALMTTGYDVLDGGTPAPNTNPVLIFRQGAGHVDPPAAMNPGLVFDSGFSDWLSFICSVQPGGGCTGVTPMDPSDLNMASIAIGAMAGVQTVTRRVTNVTGAATTFSASVSGMVGFAVTVSPASLDLAPGETEEFTVTFLRTAATLNSYTGGQLRWTDGTRTVRIPMVVRPVALAAPAEASGSYDVTFGFDGPFSAMPRGLVPAAVTAGIVDQDPDQTFDPNDPTGTVAVLVDIPAGTTYARFALFDGDVAPGSDIDLFVFGPGGGFVGQSAAGGSDEVVNLSNPAAGTYTVFVHGWGLPEGSSPFRLHAWALGSEDAGNMTVTAPDTAVTGTAGTIQLDFTGLDAGTKYLGSVAYGGAAGLPAPTIIRVDTP